MHELTIKQMEIACYLLQELAIERTNKLYELKAEATGIITNDLNLLNYLLATVLELQAICLLWMPLAEVDVDADRRNKAIDYVSGWLEYCDELLILHGQLFDLTAENN